MARGKSRGAPVAVAIQLGIVAISGTIGAYVGNQGGSPTPWFVASGVSLAIAILVYFAAYWVLPRFRRGRGEPSDEGVSITLENVSNVTIESNVPKEQIKEVNMKDVHDTDLRLNPSEGEGGNDHSGSD